MDTCLLRKIRMFKIGSIIPSGSQNDSMAANIHIIHCLSQQFCVIPVIAYGVLLKEGWRTSSAEFSGDHGI